MKVSVVVPAYNAEKTIGLCLKSLTNQSYPKELFEIITVNDGSTDSTLEVINKYSVTCITQNNQGPAAARNNGAKEASGELLLFTDADCIPNYDWIEQMTAPFANEKTAAVKGGYRTDQKEIVARFAQLEFEERFDILEKAGHTDMVDTYSAGYRRNIFKKLQGFDTRFPVANNEDTELSYRMISAGHFLAFNPKAIVAHLDHPDSLVRYAKLKFSRGYWRMVVYRLFPEKMLKDTYTPKTLKIQILSFLLLLGGLFLSMIWKNIGIAVTLSASVTFILSIYPFTLKALQKDFVVGLCTPFLLALRAGSIGFGAIWGKFMGRLPEGKI